MKVDNDVDVQSEGDPIAVDTDEGYKPSAFSIMKAKSEVSTIVRWFLWRWFMCVFVL